MEFDAPDVHVWQVGLDDDTADSLFNVLSHDEQCRAERFATRELQLHYRRCRSALRTILSRYTGQPAAGLCFEYNRFGKPALADQAWHFNVSHSGVQARIAIARQCVGIDIEALDKPGIDIDELAQWVCHPLEKTALERLPESERRRQFYRLWTQKEAYCKALGIGLQRALSDLYLDSIPALHVARVIDGHVGSTLTFFVHELPVMAGYTASLCIASTDARITTFAYSSQGAHCACQ
jgi:4'-phosphopantetheinyl transferase